MVRAWNKRRIPLVSSGATSSTVYALLAVHPPISLSCTHHTHTPWSTHTRFTNLHRLDQRITLVIWMKWSRASLTLGTPFGTHSAPRRRG